MATPESVERTVDLAVRNVGGIDETEVTFEPGVTVLAGRNATNRTSLLQAVMAALGSDRVSLKGDADEGSAELTVGDERYTRTLERAGDGVATGGDPYLDDPAVADLFAFLLEDNEARRAVARGDDLRDVIMRPVDTDAIEREIADLEAEKRRLDDELAELDRLSGKLPELESERAELREELDDARERLREKEAALDDGVEEPRDAEAELEAKLDELGQARGRLERVDRDVDSTETSLAALREEREELLDRRADLPDAPDEAVEDVRSEMNRLRERKQEVQSTISDLQTVVQFNEDVLQGSGADVLDVLGDDDGAPTDRLLADDETVTCWTCGSSVPTDQVVDTLDTLRSLREDHVARQRELADSIDELRAEKETLEDQRRRHEEVERRLSGVDEEIAQRESKLATLRERREEVAAEIDRLESTVEALEREEYSEVLAAHREANELEFEVERLERELDDVDEEIARVESQLERRETLESERDAVDEQLTDDRTRIERLERTAVQAFNDHMEAVLDALAYDNLERVWIERLQHDDAGAAGTVTGAAFELHVVRATESGSVYEDTVDHLSESEREVTGLVFALAGYLVHEVHETVPFMLLDSLEAIDAERISRLVEHLREHADYLVVALLEEDAAALDEQFPRVSDI